jgi:large subunit ribosomal protein L25
MKTFELVSALRNTTGKKATKNLRRDKQVPCVVYGGKKPIHFSAEERAFKDLVYSPHVYAVKLNIDGDIHTAVMKEIQFHPVTDVINHIDFVEVDSKKPIIIELPVEITGNSIGIRAGGKLRQRKRYIKVKGLIEKLPDSLVIDISDLDIGGAVLTSDLTYDAVEILEPARSLIVGVISARAASKGMGEATEGTTPAEGAAPAAAPAAGAAPAEQKK